MCNLHDVLAVDPVWHKGYGSCVPVLVCCGANAEDSDHQNFGKEEQNKYVLGKFVNILQLGTHNQLRLKKLLGNNGFVIYKQ